MAWRSRCRWLGVNGAADLPVCDADTGSRDVRINVVLMQSFSRTWHLGIGMNYRRLMDDAADSPVVADRGTANQFVFGIGGAYAW